MANHKALHIALLGLLLPGVVLAATPTGQTGPTVLVATPMLSSDMSPAVASSLERVFDQGIVAAGAKPADRDLAASKAKKLGVTLATRTDAVRVANALGAAVVLRYEAKMVGLAIKVRAVVFYVATGKAVLLEREIEFRDLGPTAAAMMKELLGSNSPNAAKAEPDKTSPAEPSQKPVAAPVKGPAPASTVTTSGNPNARSGLVARFNIGASAPIGEGHEDLTIGVRIGGELGYQIRLGNIHAITPELTVGLARWGAKDTTDDYGNPVEVSGGLSLFHLMAGVRYDLCLGPVVLWPAVRVGFALAGGKLEAGGTTYMDDSNPGFVMDFAFGAQYMIVPYFGAGIFFDVIKAFVSDLTYADQSTTASVGASGISFGLHLTGKLPL